jgi:hypothetical protein
MASAIYTLCALTACACAFLLLRGYARTRFRLLLWSGLCFAGLCVNNVVLILDKFVFLAADLSPVRQAIAFASVALLVFGLVLESDT